MSLHSILDALRFVPTRCRPRAHTTGRPPTFRPRLELLEDRCLLSADFVLDWNRLLLDVQQVRAQGNQQAARALAMMGAAVYDSVNAIAPTHAVYHVDAGAFPGTSTASADAAAAQAAHDVAYALYTQTAERNRFDALLTDELDPNEIPDGQAKDNGIALGHYVAAQVLAWRANDGSSASVAYQPGTGPGAWQPTPPNPPGTVPATPQWPYVTPFVWDHHIARSKYEKYARAAWPAEDGETITVELDPFGLENSADEEE